jgi:hypothetical protein
MFQICVPNQKVQGKEHYLEWHGLHMYDPTFIFTSKFCH